MNIQSEKEKLEKIRKKHFLSLIILHGSQVGGKLHPKSDIDIAIVRNNPKRKLILLELLKDLSNIFDSDKIDISDLTHADPLFLYSATRKSKLLAGKRKDFDELLRLAFHKYSDYLPYLKKENLFVKERINTYVSD